MSKGLLSLNQQLNLSTRQDIILDHILKTSIQDYLNSLALSTHQSLPVLQAYLKRYVDERRDQLHLFPEVPSLLKRLKQQGARHFMQTHSDHKAIALLESFGILKLFDEVITSERGFKRKPSSEGIDYLLTAYQLDPKQSWYIGDRSLDVEAAQNASINSLLISECPLLIQPDHQVKSLKEAEIFLLSVLTHEDNLKLS